MTSTRSIGKLLLGLTVAAVMAGCASTKLDSDVPVESRSPTPLTPGGASQVTPVDAGAARSSALSNLPRLVYFDYDSYVVKDDYRQVVDVNAKALSADRKRRVSIEGHTDDRGGSEYNLALGQKRAEAVAKSLTLLGAGDSQIEAVSFGKERPAAQGENEAAWAKNRRAELNYR